MERMGPEASLLMAAAPIRYVPVGDDRALWELPLDRPPVERTLLAAAPAVAPSRRPRGARAWFAALHWPARGVRGGGF
jgi:hypothetical protein